MRQGGVPKCYVESIEDMCSGANGRLRSESRPTSGNGTQAIHVCHNLGRANERCRKRAPYDMMFADRILLYRKDEEEFEVSLDRWRKVIEERGSKVSRKKTEYVEVGGAEQGTVYIQGGGDGEEG